MLDEAFWAIHSDLPREGPGDNASTARAYDMMRELPDAPTILDIACGPGMQTLELARLGAGRVTAVDLHQPFLDELGRRARATGLADYIDARRASMFDLPFEDAAFDVVWCEGALYMMGFRHGLTAWRRLLKPGGYVAVTEPVLLRPRAQTPAPVLAAWASYPAMTTLQATLDLLDQVGLQYVGHFLLPESAWWDGYYRPMAAKLPALRARHAGDPMYERRIAEAQGEIDAYRRFSAFYGYLFVITRAT